MSGSKRSRLYEKAKVKTEMATVTVKQENAGKGEEQEKAADLMDTVGEEEGGGAEDAVPDEDAMVRPLIFVKLRGASVGLVVE